MKTTSKNIGSLGEKVGHITWFLIKIALCCLAVEIYSNSVRYRAYEKACKTMGESMCDVITAYEHNRDEFKKDGAE